MPDHVNMKDGTATFKASHFSILGFGNLPKQSRSRHLLQTYAADEYNRRQEKARLNGAVGKTA